MFVDALAIVNTAYVAATLCIVLAKLVPNLNILLKYGKVLQGSHATSPINPIVNVYVPKKRFTDFYILDFLFASFNLYILRFKPKNVVSLLKLLPNSNEYTISTLQFRLIIMLNMIQSLRRCYECFYVSKFSKNSKIHISHYFVGLFFYSTVNLIPLLQYISTDVTSSNKVDYSNMIIIVFLLASVDQYFNHQYLSQLVKYTIPNSRLFKFLSCPHYLDEIIIYLCQFLIMRNLSYFLIFLWVLVNLTASADQTYLYYSSKLKKNPKYYWRLLPFLF